MTSYEFLLVKLIALLGAAALGFLIYTLWQALA
jgi:hypothetical protein